MAKNKKDKPKNLYMLFQMEKCKLSYDIHLKNEHYDSLISEYLEVQCKTILSDYKSIKVDDEIKIAFRLEPYLTNEKCNPKSFGWLNRENKQHCFHISVTENFPERLDFILNRGLKPFFYIVCEKEKYEHATIKSFSMESEVVVEDYMPC